MFKRPGYLAVCWGALLAVVPALRGNTLDPSTLHIGTGAGTPCAVGCAGAPNAISPTVFDVFQTDNGANPLTSPLLVILGIPNFSGAAPMIAGVTVYSPYAGTATGGTSLSAANFGVASMDFFGGTWTPGSNAVAILMAGQEAYSKLGLPGANNSNSFTNWSGADFTRNGITATSFGLYVYAINANLVANGLFDISWSGGGLAPGTFAIAYGCQPATGGNCTANPNPYNTPFTEAGNVQVPEPGTLALLASGLLGLAGVVGRRLLVR